MSASVKRKADPDPDVEYIDDHAASLFLIIKSDLENSARFRLSESGITLEWDVNAHEVAFEEIEVRTVADFRACLNKYYLPADGFCDAFLSLVLWQAIKFVNSRAIRLDECGRVDQSPETVNG